MTIVDERNKTFGQIAENQAFFVGADLYVKMKPYAADEANALKVSDSSRTQFGSEQACILADVSVHVTA